NLPANFTATTANAIEFQNSAIPGREWFNASGDNAYGLLVGEPAAFAFADDAPGAVVNAGDLTLAAAQQLTLIGGTTVNTGTLATPGGMVTLAAVPGESIVRLSQEGQLLNLEIAERTLEEQTQLGVNPPAFSPQMLPALLTNQTIAEATQLRANADGTVQLMGAASGLPGRMVDCAGGGSGGGCAIAAGRFDVSNTTLIPDLNSPQVGGTVAILGDTVDTLDALIDVSGLSGEGNSLIEPFNPSGVVSLPIPLGFLAEDATAGQLTGQLTGNQSLNPLVEQNASPVVISPLNGRIPARPLNGRLNDGPTGELQSDRQTGRRASRQGNRSNLLRSPKARGLHRGARAVLGNASASAALDDIEEQRVQEFSDYFGRQLNTTELTPDKIQTLLTDVHTETGHRSVIVYVKAPSADPPALGTPALDTLNAKNNFSLKNGLEESTSTPLEILIFTATEDPVSLTVPNVSRDQLFQAAADLNSTLVTSVRRNSTNYLTPAQQLYQWLIQPIEDELGPESIDTVLFSMDSGLRSLPIATLHDGEQFLIEKYSLGMVPSLSFMAPEYAPVKREKVLAMGASDFETLQPLRAVPTELETIGELWQSQDFLNDDFTLQNLVQQQSQDPAQIIHLATHAAFNPGNASHSYIQLWDEQLQLSDIHTLGWDLPAVDLLVLSACQTALGDAQAEMGFAGLAVATGVNSALASLWSVSDVGTLALMSEFYDQLRTAPIKSEALRRAQLAMLQGDMRVEEGQLLREFSQGFSQGEGDRTRSARLLPPELSNASSPDLSHPYYWSGFTLIGSPW
ncbi:MAG: CHAT domain-containing protein, partial [Cyanobacteria bacterium J06598_3]